MSSFVASRDNFIKLYKHLPWWREHAHQQLQHRERVKTENTQSMKCEYAVKFRLVRTISPTVFYMRNFITFIIHTKKHIIYYYGHLIDLGRDDWNAFGHFSHFEWIHPFGSSIVLATAKRKILRNIKLWNGNVWNLFESTNETCTEAGGEEISKPCWN